MHSSQDREFITVLIMSGSKCLNDFPQTQFSIELFVYIWQMIIYDCNLIKQIKSKWQM